MEIVMIKAFELKGIVVNIWKCTVAILFCLACYRHPDLPPKPLNEIRTAAYFVTSWVLKNHLGAPVVVEKNYRVRVHGFLQSRDYEESIADFLKDSRGAELLVWETLDPSEERAPRGTT
jgi:hypothetical protein